MVSSIFYLTVKLLNWAFLIDECFLSGYIDQKEGKDTITLSPI